jgi:TatD DNase family protein
MELIDTHCHLTFDDLAGDIDGVLARSRAAGITKWITVGTEPRDNRKAIEFAEKHQGAYAAVGIHPHDAKTVTDAMLGELKKLTQHRKVVAIGETGLDYHYNLSLHEDQRRVFAEHLKIAAESKLPVIIHCRKAFEETLEVLQRHGREVEKIVFHCFSGSAQQAKIVLDTGYYISFTGVVTFKNAQNKRAAAEIVPLDRLMLETDCPYMSPEPVRKQRPNEPALMIHIAKCLAELKDMDVADFAQAVTATSKAFFQIS